MPFFVNKFSPKKPPERKSVFSLLKSEEIAEDLLVGENRTIRLKLGQQECLFENGQWVPENGVSANAHRNNRKQEMKIQELLEENNMLKLKYEILLNMLTQTTAESHLQQREIEKLQNKMRIK